MMAHVNVLGSLQYSHYCVEWRRCASSTADRGISVILFMPQVLLECKIFAPTRRAISLAACDITDMIAKNTHLIDSSCSPPISASPRFCDDTWTSSRAMPLPIGVGRQLERRGHYRDTSTISTCRF